MSTGKIEANQTVKISFLRGFKMSLFRVSRFLHNQVINAGYGRMRIGMFPFPAFNSRGYAFGFW
jgi:hypothetical protein